MLANILFKICLLFSHFLSKHFEFKLCITKIKSVVLYLHETFSLTLTEDHSSRMFDNGMLRRIFWSRTEEWSRGRRKQYNGEIHNL